MEADKALININLQPIADVANNLINKISAAVGWTFTHNTPGRIGVETLIKDIQDMKIDPIHKKYNVFDVDIAKESIDDSECSGHAEKTFLVA